MSYLAMTAAPIESNGENKKGTQDVINNLKKINRQNRTRRRLETNKPMFSHEENVTELKSDFGENNLEDFTPLSTPESVGVERRKEREVLKEEDRNEMQNQPVSPYTSLSNQQDEQPANINDTPMGSDINVDNYRKNLASYYQQHNPDLQNLPPTQKSELTEKLNYLIHLLEEQQDEKTQNVTEEVILYSFLGIFIIFVVDSFARVGKYVR
jgi:hypothetical protein